MKSWYIPGILKKDFDILMDNMFVLNFFTFKSNQFNPEINNWVAYNWHALLGNKIIWL